MLRTVFLCFLGLALPAQAAQSAQSAYWEYGDWRISYEFSESEEHTLFSCVLQTGGDGMPAVRLYFTTEPGGHFHEPPAMTVEETAPRHHRTVMRDDEQAYIVFDDGTGAYAPAHTWRDADGFEIASMGFTDPDLAALIPSLRTRQYMDVVSGGRHITRASLTGFTAALLKASEQCGFDPDRPTGPP